MFYFIFAKLNIKHKVDLVGYIDRNDGCCFNSEIEIETAIKYR